MAPYPEEEEGDRKSYAMSILHGIEWVGGRPSDEIIVLLRLLVMDALHLSQTLLHTAGSHLLCSSLSFTWYDMYVHGDERNPVKMAFQGNVAEFMAALFYTSPPALPFLLENYSQEVVHCVNWNKILRSFQRVRRGMEEWDLYPIMDEFKFFEKVVQRLHELGTADG